MIARKILHQKYYRRFARLETWLGGRYRVSEFYWRVPDSGGLVTVFCEVSEGIETTNLKIGNYSGAIYSIKTYSFVDDRPPVVGSHDGK